MRRCLELALLGAGHTAPNPMVGAVLVHEDRIIGEGYHRQYGQAHAEVNCLASVKEGDIAFVAHSTLYVSLEPCAHHGKTPPCADLIIEKKIPRVVVGCRDPFSEVDGKGIEKLRAAGVEVVMGLLEKECIDVNRRFFIFHTRHRPYIVLKWAQTANGKMGVGSSQKTGGGSFEKTGNGSQRVLISNEYSNRLVHKWRGEEAAILVGTNTALADDPALTVRLWSGPNPIRLVIDKDLRLPGSLKLFDSGARTIVFNRIRHAMEGFGAGRGQLGIDAGQGQLGFDADQSQRATGPGNVFYYQVADDSDLVHQLAVALHREKILSVLVEGGARLLQSFLDAGYWDEARVITNRDMLVAGGLAAPILEEAVIRHREELFSDSISYYQNLKEP